MMEIVVEDLGSDAVAMMCWLNEGTGADGSWQKFNRPVLAAGERSKLPAGAIQALDGLELVFNVPREVVARFEGQVIDFTEGPGLHLRAT
jgi:hypothetical protein